MSGAGDDDPRPVTGIDDLVAYLATGEKPARALAGRHRAREDRPLPAAATAACPSRAPRGIAAVLERVAELDGWKRIREGAHLIALEKDGASITLEPGGQLELSGAPLRTIHETCSEFQRPPRR